MPRKSLSWYVIALLTVWWGSLAIPTQAQLISPGKLSRFHQDLEGIRQCTSCHTLGQKGIDAVRCLDCHRPLKARLDANKGYHASVKGKNCAECHKEHFGLDFTLVRFDTTRFDHRETGFRLVSAHTEVSCRSCHRPENIVSAEVRSFKGKHKALNRTFLGLDTRCLSCHQPDSPHQDQFARRDCGTCHTEEKWEEAPKFNHAETKFPLTGQHRQVQCVSCHPERKAGTSTFLQFEKIAFSQCSVCHDDAHQGAFGATCNGCHVTSGWHQVQNLREDRFNHNATGFPLIDRHASLPCASCHTRPARKDQTIQITFVRGSEQNSYPRPEASDCLACHVDFHQNSFAQTPGGPVCENCHSQTSWSPTRFDLDRHNRQTSFTLVGAHLATPCVACHKTDNQWTFHFTSTDCQTCHATDNPHEDHFADTSGKTICSTCHTTEAWKPAPGFDHSITKFPLTGRHQEVGCASCHTSSVALGNDVEWKYSGLATDCLGCHQSDNPHQNQFEGQVCETCHTTMGFKEAAKDFDHNKTRFALEGAHASLLCEACHKTELTAEGISFVRYRPLKTSCKYCHKEE